MEIFFTLNCRYYKLGNPFIKYVGVDDWSVSWVTILSVKLARIFLYYFIAYVIKLSQLTRFYKSELSKEAKFRVKIQLTFDLEINKKKLVQLNLE